MKITVTGNTQSDWVSITEIDVIGGVHLRQILLHPQSQAPVLLVVHQAFQLLHQLQPHLANQYRAGLVQQYLRSKTVTGTSIAGSLSLSSDAKTATFKPSSSLDFQHLTLLP